jgi:lipopolysaccharide export system permease protein
LIIFRYLAKEVFVNLFSLTAILMLIFLSNQFVLYLNRAASGNIPGVIVMKLMMLEMPTLMAYLLPLGFYMALLLAYGRLYAESEMTVLRANGYGPNQLLKHSYVMASLVTVIVLAMMVWASPIIAEARAKLFNSAGIQTLIQTVTPGRFRGINHGMEVFYVQSMGRDHKQAEQVFLAKHSQSNQLIQWDILWADKAFAETDPKNSENYLILQSGKEYRGVPGRADYQVAEFAKYKTRLPKPSVVLNEEDVRTYKFTRLLSLYHSKNLEVAAELQWRLSVPLMALTLTLVAVPLSRVNARTGKFAKLLPAIFIYILYANGMFVARDAIASGKVPLWIGMWWLHLSMVVLGLILIWINKIKLA